VPQRTWLLLLLPALRRLLGVGEPPPPLCHLIDAIADAEMAFHAAKGALSPALLPAWDDGGKEDREKALGYCLDPENVDRLTQDLTRSLAVSTGLARQSWLYRQAVAQMGSPWRETFRAALEALIQEAPRWPLALKQLHRHAQAYARRAEAAPAARKSLCDQAEGTIRDLWAQIGTREQGFLGVLNAALETLRLDRLLAEAHQAHSAHAEALGVEWILPEHLDPLLRVPGDPAALRRALDIVLDNAFDAIAQQSRLAGPGYTGRLEVEVVTIADSVHLRLRDNGCGLPPEVLAALREGRQASTKGSGRGLGLLHLRRLLQAYPGGALTIDSPGPGQGATVTLVFQNL
jgi:signal transduction histidine kinase